FRIATWCRRNRGDCPCLSRGFGCSVRYMYAALVAVSIVALGALAVCAAALVQVGQMHKAAVDLLADTLRSKDSMVSRAHGSIGMALTEAASKTATAIGQAVQAAVTPSPAPAPGTSE